MTLILIILWAFTAGSVIFLRKATLVSYFSCVTVIFLLQVLPKILAYDSWGFSAFLESTVDFSTNNVQTANILIFSFIITINLCYMTNPPNVLEAYSATDIVTWNRRSESVARFAVLGVFLPLSGVALAFYLSQIGFSMDMLIAKREFQIDGTITPAYIGQKVAQISKSGFYLACIGYVCSQNKKRWFRIMLLMSLLTSVVYVTSSQRSGVLILLLEIFLTLLIGKRLRVRTFVIFGAMFALVSLKILFFALWRR